MWGVSSGIPSQTLTSLPEGAPLSKSQSQLSSKYNRSGLYGEAIYATRPWKIFGDGPVATAPPSNRGPRFNEAGRKDFTADEVRFTAKGNTLYAFVMGWPEKEAVIKPLATTSTPAQIKVQNVELAGCKGRVQWAQGEIGLTVRMPEEKPCDHAIAMKIATWRRRTVTPLSAPAVLRRVPRHLTTYRRVLPIIEPQLAVLIISRRHAARTPATLRAIPFAERRRSSSQPSSPIRETSRSRS